MIKVKGIPLTFILLPLYIILIHISKIIVSTFIGIYFQKKFNLSNVQTFVSAFFGLKLARKVNLKLNFNFDKKSLVLAILIGFTTGVIITVSDRFIFAGYLSSQVTNYVFSPIYFILGILYGRISEVIFLRLFVISLFVVILWKLFTKSNNDLNIPDWIYVSSIVLSPTLFAAGHIRFTAQSIRLSTPILIRDFILN